ncbi:MAG: Nramp family divalent metal transporter [Thermacetogeniaceae bacterium]
MSSTQRYYDFAIQKGQTLLSMITDMGPGFLVTIGFIDPGNIAANVVAGAHFGYTLLWVVLLGTLLLILLQEMSARLGIASGLCLSEATRKLVGPVASIPLGIIAGIASVSTVAAEVLGAAVGLNILFHLPLALGSVLVAAAAGLAVWTYEYHHVEDLIIGIVGIIGFSYLIELFLARPEWHQVLLHTFVPQLNASNVFIAVSLLGAIVMPSNFYLHSAIIQGRNWSGSKLKREFFDTTVSMVIGGLINAAIIVVAASVFYQHGARVDTLEQAADTLIPLAGGVAHLLFAIVLVFAGFSSAITGAMAGSYAIGGFFFHPPSEGVLPWHHETRPFRIGFLVVLVLGTIIPLLPINPLQVILASQATLGILLIFSAVPLLLLMRKREYVGSYRNGPLFNCLGWLAVGVLVFINCYLLFVFFLPVG